MGGQQEMLRRVVLGGLRCVELSGGCCEYRERRPWGGVSVCGGRRKGGKCTLSLGGVGQD